jgi:hypothetical protein
MRAAIWERMNQRPDFWFRQEVSKVDGDVRQRRERLQVLLLAYGLVRIELAAYRRGEVSNELNFVVSVKQTGD